MPDAKIDRTPEEIAAEVLRIRAETENFQAMSIKNRAEGERAQHEADSGALLFEQAKEHYDANRVSDDKQHLYRFNYPVVPESVGNCIATMNRWSRLDEGCEIEIRFSSPGGSIFDGFVLYDEIQLLRSRGHKITSGCVGMAASMAGVLLQAGDHRWMGSEALILIHRGQFGAMGSSYEVEDQVELIKRLEERIIQIFVARTSGRLTKAKITNGWKRKDWWIHADEALTLGLVDEVRRAPQWGQA